MLLWICSIGPVRSLSHGPIEFQTCTVTRSLPKHAFHSLFTDQEQQRVDFNREAGFYGHWEMGDGKLILDL